MNDSNSSNLLMIYALTPLHVGVGAEEGVVDLPVQKDILGYPCIYSSSLKGALRSHFELNSDGNECIKTVFGDQDGVGGYNFQDAYLLAIPARMRPGIVVGVTSPYLLRNLYRYHSIYNSGRLPDDINIEVDYESYIPLYPEPTLNDEIVVNEVSLRRRMGGTTLNDIIRDLVGRVTNKLGRLVPYRNIIIVNDDLFKDVILPRSMMIVTRVSLQGDTKKVSAGPWTEEYVPPGSIFYTFINSNRWVEDEDCLSKLLQDGGFDERGVMIFIGGNETIGKGFVYIEFSS